MFWKYALSLPSVDVGGGGGGGGRGWTRKKLLQCMWKKVKKGSFSKGGGRGGEVEKNSNQRSLCDYDYFAQ